VRQNGLSIGDVVEATGLGEATLRAWERRYGFPAPSREPSGHRRYTADDIERLLRIVEERDRGVPLAAAVGRTLATSGAAPSLFARLRVSRPELQPIVMRKRHMVHLSHAIEDESAARAERSILVGAFQRERFYRLAQPRWRDLARGAELAVAFADFPKLRRPRGAAVEVPVDREHPMAREWALICASADHAACMIGWEPPARSPSHDLEREFEVILSVDPAVVRDAVEAAAAVAAAPAPELAEALRSQLADLPAPRADSQLRLAGAITARMVGALR
jgi:MerR family transcriptional regulator, light-induced transcriptional regulator